MLATVQELLTYPVKGLTPQKIDRAFLTEGHGIKGDRAFALLFTDTVDHISPLMPWLSKKHFAVQNDWPDLAALDCQYVAQTGLLTITSAGKNLLVADVKTEAGRDRISEFFSTYIHNLTPTSTARHPHKSPVKLVGDVSGNTRYADREPVHISLISRATFDHLTEIAQTVVDPLRFRPNVIIDGVKAWEEFNWIGQELKLGESVILVTAKIGRCVNIEVEPTTGQRDLPLLSLLQTHFGHAQTGILAQVIKSGPVAIGDILE